METKIFIQAALRKSCTYNTKFIYNFVQYIYIKLIKLTLSNYVRTHRKVSCHLRRGLVWQGSALTKKRTYPWSFSFGVCKIRIKKLWNFFEYFSVVRRPFECRTIFRVHYEATDDIFLCFFIHRILVSAHFSLNELRPRSVNCEDMWIV